MIPVFWSKSAREDLAALEDYYSAIRPEYAERVTVVALQGTEILSRHPAAGSPTAEAGVRKWRVAQTPYSLLYRILPSEIRIVRIVHSATDWHNRL